MTIRNIQNQLASLEINSITQLESNDIDYWWQIKFKKIQSDKTITGEKKQSLLVEINNARDELYEIEGIIIKQILKENQEYYNDPENENSFSDSKKDFNPNKQKPERISIEESWWLAPLVYGIYRLIRYYIENN